MALIGVVLVTFMSLTLWLGRENDRLRHELAAVQRELHVFHVAYGNRLTQERDFQ